MKNTTNNSKCKLHGKTVEMYCENCKEFICSFCLQVHSGKGCKYPEHVSSYIKKNVLPKYNEKIKILDAKKDQLNEFAKTFKSYSGDFLKNLKELKYKFTSILEAIDESIETLSIPLPSLDSVYITAKTKAETEYRELIKAIEDERIDFLVKKMSEKVEVNVVELGDSEYRFIEALNNNILTLLSFKQPDEFLENLKAFQSLYKKFSDKSKVEVLNDSVYGVYRNMSNHRQLCKYNIHTKKLKKLVMVPSKSTATQIGKRIFISGGEDPAVSTVSEYVETLQSLITKCSMNYVKYNHATEAISTIEFVTVGGFDKSGIRHCERYNVVEDKWRLLPLLNYSRYGLGTVFLLNKYLYAIGGSDEKNTIEMLNIDESKQWVFVSLALCEMDLDKSLKGFPISDNEILLLCGGETTVGLLNIKENTVKKSELKTKVDRFNFNSVSIIEGNAYIVGNGFGHVHVYKFKEKVFDDIDFSDISIH